MADSRVDSDVSCVAEHIIPSGIESVPTEEASEIRTSDATVVVATYDPERWSFLTAAVESLLAGPDRPGRVVICVDKNEDLYERIRMTWPQVTTIRNSRGRGASGTRNTGAELADTPFIVFLDDDIQVRQGWLSCLLKPFADPAVVGTGGSVMPGWQSGRPYWFPEEFDWVVGASYHGMPTVQSVVRNVWSENMAVRAEVFRNVGGFRSEFGKVGRRNSPEDTDLCIRMAANVAGARWVYAPAAVAEHHVPASRASFSYFLRRNYLEGRGKLEMARLLGPQEKLRDERNYLLRRLPSGIVAGLWTTARHGDISGLFKAGAIVAGILAAAIGAVSAMCPPTGALLVNSGLGQGRRSPISNELHGALRQISVRANTDEVADRPQSVSTPLRARNRAVSVVIPCFDVQRVSLLMRAVQSVRDQDYPHELTVVVDYNEELYERLLSLLPMDVFIMRNKRSPGAAGARNSAALASGSPLVAFLDDDACARPGWIRSLAQAMDEPGVVGVGGRILPLWLEECPRWFPPELGWVIGASIATAGPGAFPVRNVWSGSMMVDREAFQSVNGFREDLSKVGRASKPEDTELCLRLSHAYGAAGRWLMVPSALVDHHVPADRATLRYVVDRCWLEGVGKVRMRAVAPDRKLALADEKAYLSRTIPHAIGAGVLQSLRLRKLDGLMQSGAILLGTAAAILGAFTAGIRAVHSNAYRGEPDNRKHREPTALWQFRLAHHTSGVHSSHLEGQ